MPVTPPVFRLLRRVLTVGVAAARSLAPRRHGPPPPPLDAAERQICDHVASTGDDQIALLARVVDIDSATMNVAGVRRVGDVFRAAFDSLGFRTRWAELPDAMGRAGTLFAEHRGAPGRMRILLVGHLDTVLEGAGHRFARADSTARGAGVVDMKGGDVVIVHALSALASAGVLGAANLCVALTGDEEAPGDPPSVSRRDLIDAARRSDVALGFEPGSNTAAIVGRRGMTTWRLTVTGKPGHSAGVFRPARGYGAVFELARILDAFRSQFAGERYLTINPGVVVGGTDVGFDGLHLAGTAAGQTNVIARSATACGDLRFLTGAQMERAQARMREIVARSLPGTSAEITFFDGYPAMPPTPGNRRLLAAYDAASRVLGYGPVKAADPARRGGGDVSFVAPYVDVLDGLGAIGSGMHSSREQVSLDSLARQTQRAAVLIHRLSRQESPAAR